MKTKKLLLTCAALLLSTELVPAFTHPGGLVPANIVSMRIPPSCSTALTSSNLVTDKYMLGSTLITEHGTQKGSMFVRKFADNFSTTYVTTTGASATSIWPNGVFQPGTVYDPSNTTIDADRTAALARAIYTLTLSALKGGTDGTNSDSSRVEKLVDSLTTNLKKIGGTDGALYTCTDLIHIVNALEIIRPSSQFTQSTKDRLLKWVTTVLKPAVIREMGFMYMANHISWACLAATLVGHATDDTLLVQQACAQTISMMDYNSKIDATTNPTFGPFYNDMVRNWNFGSYGAAYTAMNLEGLTFNAIALYNIYKETNSVYGCNLFNYTSPNGTSLKSIAGWFNKKIDANQFPKANFVDEITGTTGFTWPQNETVELKNIKILNSTANPIKITGDIQASSFLCSYFEIGFQNMSGCEFKIPELINDGATRHNAYFNIVSVPQKKWAINDLYSEPSNGPLPVLPATYTCTLTLINRDSSYDILKKGGYLDLTKPRNLEAQLCGFDDGNHNMVMPILGFLYNDLNWKTLSGSTTPLPNFSAISDGGVNAKMVGLLYFGVLDNSISSPTPLDITLPNTSRRNAAPVSLLQFVH